MKTLDRRLRKARRIAWNLNAYEKAETTKNIRSTLNVSSLSRVENPSSYALSAGGEDAAQRVEADRRHMTWEQLLELVIENARNVSALRVAQTSPKSRP
jgi:hypothetical protein